MDIRCHPKFPFLVLNFARGIGWEFRAWGLPTEPSLASRPFVLLDILAPGRLGHCYAHVFWTRIKIEHIWIGRQTAHNKGRGCCNRSEGTNRLALWCWWMSLNLATASEPWPHLRTRARLSVWLFLKGLVRPNGNPTKVEGWPTQNDYGLQFRILIAF